MTAKMQDQKTFSHLLSTLLIQASYSPELQQQYRAINSSSTFAHWTSNLTHNGSPFEPSRNLQNGQSLLRFTIEPSSSIAGTPADPFNQSASFTLVKQLAKLDLFEGFDTELWEFFTKEFFVWHSGQVEIIREKMHIKDHNLRLRSCLLAFDLKKKEPGIMLKGYVNFFRKATILEISPLAMICEAVRRLEGREDEKIALDRLEEFATRSDGGYKGIQNMARGNIAQVNGLNLVMVSFDFIERLKARIKIYARSYDLTFSNFKEIYSLGGQLQIDEKELTVFKAFYGALFGLSEDWDGLTEHVERMNSRHAGVLWQFELMHGKQIPVIKLYISFWNFVPNDAEAAKRLKRFFKTQSWELADSYSAQIEELFDMGNVEKEAGRHSYVSFSYTKEKGPYLTLYYAPKLEREQ